MDDEWQLRRVRVPKGTHFSDSKETPGAERELLREDGTNKLLGPPESFPVDQDAMYGVPAYEPDLSSSAGEPELSPSQQALADAIADLFETVIREAVIPVIKEYVAPGLKRKMGDFAKRRRASSGRALRKSGPEEVAALAAASSESSSSEVDAAVEEPRISMSLDDFREYLLRAVAAEEFAAQLKRMLSNVQINDDDLTPELRDAIRLVLEGNASSLDGDTLTIIMSFLGGERIVEGEYALSRRQKTKEPPPLTDGKV